LFYYFAFFADEDIIQRLSIKGRHSIAWQLSKVQLSVTETVKSNCSRDAFEYYVASSLHGNWGLSGPARWGGCPGGDHQTGEREHWRQVFLCVGIALTGWEK